MLVPRHTGRRRVGRRKRGHPGGNDLLFLHVTFPSLIGFELRLWMLVEGVGCGAWYVVVDLFVNSSGIVH